MTKRTVAVMRNNILTFADGGVIDFREVDAIYQAARLALKKPLLDMVTQKMDAEAQSRWVVDLAEMDAEYGLPYEVDDAQELKTERPLYRSERRNRKDVLIAAKKRIDSDGLIEQERDYENDGYF